MFLYIQTKRLALASVDENKQIHTQTILSLLLLLGMIRKYFISSNRIRMTFVGKEEEKCELNGEKETSEN